MQIAVAGLWHLGNVYAACLASGGHNVLGIDEPERIRDLQRGILPVAEPGLTDLVRQEVTAGRLSFASERDLVKSADILWICYDTPVEADGTADVDFVTSKIEALLPHVADGALVLISSQLPVGTVARMRERNAAICQQKRVTFGYSPENLRLGSSIAYFLAPDRVVVGLEAMGDRQRVTELLLPFSTNIVWMSLASAEMVKHALNTFFATSIAFINEIAALCEVVGADALEVEKGLKSDLRIGQKSYLHPGGAFAGGTLVRDLTFLLEQGSIKKVATSLLHGVRSSNDYHKGWNERKAMEILHSLSAKKIAVLGLTYKPGTNTLRGSTSIEFCEWAAGLGAIVQAYDPAIGDSPEEIEKGTIRLCGSAAEALLGTELVVINTPCPEFKNLRFEDFSDAMDRVQVLDAARFLEDIFTGKGNASYAGIGMAR